MRLGTDFNKRARDMAVESADDRCHAGAQDPARSSRVTVFRLLVSTLVLATLVGGVLALQRLMWSPDAATRVSIASMGNADGLWFTVQSAVWVNQDRKNGRRVPLFSDSIPAAKPQSLQLELKVQNRGDEARVLGPQDFRLWAQNGTTWIPTGPTFPLAPLGPRQYLHTVLSFDAPETSSGLQLVWNRSGQEVRVLVKAPVRDSGKGESKGQDVSSCLPTLTVRCADGPRISPGRAQSN